MAKSTTKKEPSEFVLEKIRRFTEQELAKQADSELPFCYQIGTDVLVGRNKIVKIDEKNWHVHTEAQKVLEFYSRKNAIFYCIVLHQHQYNLAIQILENDNLLNKLEFEAILYRHRYKSATQKQDAWGAEYYSNKYLEIQHRLKQVNKELQKTLNLAKYIKV